MENKLEKNANPKINWREIPLIVSIRKHFLYILFISYFKWLVIGGIVGGVLGFTLGWFKPIKYSSHLSFILEEGKSGSAGLSSLAGQLGLDIAGPSSNSNMLIGDNIIGLLTSRLMVEKSLLSVYDSTKKTSLADKYAEVYNLKTKWQKKFNTTIAFTPSANRDGLNRLHDSLLQLIENNIMKEELSVERKDKKMTFINVDVTMKEDELLNKFFAERLVKEAIQFYIETKTRRQRSNVDRLQRRADSIVALLNRQTYSAANAQSRSLNANPAYQSEFVGTEVNLRDKAMLGTIYAEVVKNLEIQKATLTQETPVIQIVDAVWLPLKKDKASKLKMLIIGGILGASLTFGMIYLRYILINKSYNGE